MKLSRFRPDRVLAVEARIALSALRDPWLVALLVLTAAVLTLAAQLPIRYSFDVGLEEGYGSDLPFTSGFYPFEPETRGAVLNWRWTTDHAAVALPGLGQRPLAVQLKVLPINAEIQQRGPKTVELWSHDARIATLPVAPQGSVYHFLLPAETQAGDQQGFEIRSATFTPSGDARAIGIPVDRVTFEAPGGPTWPPWPSLLTWLLAAVVAWLGVRRCGFAPRATFGVLIVPAVLLSIAAVCDPLRVAFGGQPALIALGFGWLLVVIVRAAVPAIADWLAIPLDESALRWLLLLLLIAFGLRYGGKIYPASMWGDIGFHANRFAEVVNGRVLLLSKNRGVDFPYPPAFYLLLAPWMLLGVDRRDLLHFAGALLDALSPFLVYTIAVLAYRPRSGETTRVNWPVLAAALYSLTAATFMTTWWNFSTHIFTQFAHLLLITALVITTPLVLEHRATARPAASRWAIGSGLVVLFALVFLGHFGFWINMSLLGGLGVGVLFVAAWRGKLAWGGVWALTLAFAAAEVVAIAGFYSAYTGLFVQQAVATQQGGLNGMAGGRAPIPFEKLWSTLWDAGFRVHFGFFPVPLALIGMALWWRHYARRDSLPELANTPHGSRFSLLAWLISGTFLIGLVFAILPFLTGSSLSTRWLMFSAWAIALAAIACVRESWRWGWPARCAAALMASYILWVTATVWLGALAYRIRPPEPF